MLHTQILRRGDAFYVVSRLPSVWGDLGLFDGKTGQITAAVALRPHTAELKPFHVRDGHLWIYVDDWLDPLPYAVLSAETLVPVTVSAMKVESSLGAVGAAWLGDAPSPR